MVYTEVPQCLGTPCTSKSMNGVGPIPLGRNLHFRISVNRMRHLKTLFDYHTVQLAISYHQFLFLIG